MGKYNADMKLNQLFKDDEERAIIAKHLGEGILTHPMLKMPGNMTLDTVKRYSKGIVKPEDFAATVAELLSVE